MSAQQLITEHIDLWTSTIKAKNTQGRGSSKKRELYGIKKLRELILELAVRGKLVPQNPNDEPASVLLDKIAAEKAQLIKDKKIKKQKMLPEITEEEKPFELPEGWEWMRLGEVTNYGTSDKVEPKSADSNTWVLELEDVEKETSSLIQKVRFSDREFKSSKNKFYKGDVLYGKLRPYLDKVLVADEDGVCTTEMIPIRAHAAISAHHLRLIMKSPYFKEYANNSTHGMSLPRMGTDKARLALIPIIPELEQHRIVAKVDELMALCDQLEQQTESSLDAHNLLVDTLLSTLTDARDAKELSDNWARFMATDGLYAGNAGAISGNQSVFDTLITTDYAVEQLKQTILQLAVQGKLVPQDPNDEPASKLLKRITAKKEQLVKDKKIKKQKTLPEITDEEKPFELPTGWEIARFGDLTSRLGSGSTPRGGKAAYVSSGIPFLRSQNVWNYGLKLDDVEYISDETHLKMGNTKVFPGDVLLNITGASLGRSTIFPEELVEANVSQHVTIIRLLNMSMGRFVHLGVLSPLVQKLVWGRQVGMAIEGLSKKVLEQFEFPIPPLEEQHRIVAKVDELMALCDQLKTQLNNAQTTQLHLSDAVVENALTT